MSVRLFRAPQCAVALLFMVPAALHADEIELRAMSPDKPVQCLRDQAGLTWRVQCDEQTRTCLYAPNAELNTAGGRKSSLERAQRCTQFSASFDRKALKEKGYAILPGLVDAPYGWMRDERGRVFQTNFDLLKRMYFGVTYSPSKILDQPAETSRMGVDFGLLVFEHTGGKDNRTRHRLRLVEGSTKVEPFAAELVIAHYDLSHRFVDPLLRITTFVGTPRRHDLHLNLGLWTEAGHMEMHRTALGNATLWRFGAAQITFDLWQSSLIDSYARVRTGLGIERLYVDDFANRGAVTGSSAFDWNWVVDKRGFHNIRFVAGVEVPRYFAPQAPAGKIGRRAEAKLSYEAIVLAINDQPLSLTLAAGGEKRNDIPGLPDKWAFVADAGLRFSLWAPPRPRQ